MKAFLLGAHMPISGGLAKSAILGKETGCTAIQIFTKSNRQWHAKKITQQDSDEFKSAVKVNHIKYVNVHASYLLNLCSTEATTAHRSATALEDELIRCNELGIKDLVLHPGAKKDQDTQTAIKKLANNLNSVLKNTPHSTRVLIENMAGQGTVIGGDLKELGKIIELVSDQDRIGVCIDTCHAFAFGYKLNTREGYQSFWEDLNKEVGRHKLSLIHLNDSQKEIGSKVDRHAEIGKGTMGNSFFKLLMNDPHLTHVPKILETPKDDLHADAKALKLLVSEIENSYHSYIKGTNLEIYL